MSKQLSAYINAYRGDFVEDHHVVSLAIVSPQGETLFTAGNPDLNVPMRSSAKPFQAQALFQSGAYRQFALSLKELALCCASHEGSAEHLQVAEGILQKLGLTEAALNCGAHLPGDKESRARLASSGQAVSAIYNNCSGKHSGMLAVAKALGASITDYETREHPVQELIFEIARALSGVSTIPYAIDGCSVPTFILPLRDSAHMWACFADPSTAPAAYQEGLETVSRAMQAHPEMVAGVGANDTVFMQNIPMLVAKRGAQGYYGLALKDSRYGPLGLTLKVENGSNEARDILLVELLEFLGVLSTATPLPWRRPEISNHRGIVTGYWEAVLG